MAEARGSILISTANKIGATLVKKLGGTGYTPSEWADKINLLGALPEDTVSGAIANFPDGAEDVPVVELISNIAPTQAGSGDPAPDNVRAISGYTGMRITKLGKNIANFVNGYGISADGRIEATASRAATIEPIPIKEGATYKYYALNGAGIIAVWKGDTLVRRVAGVASGTTINTSDGDRLYLCSYKSGTSTIEEDKPMCILSTETNTDYEPYTSEVKSISWETEAGTVYGGSLNVTTGELTVTHGMVTFNGSEDWTDYSSYNGYYINVPSMKSGTRQAGYSNYLVNSSSSAHTQNSYWLGVNSNRIFLIEVYESMGSTIADLKSYLSSNPLTFVFPLATPEVYQLDPVEVNTLLGVNNFYNDTNGDTEVNYRADTDLYIAKKLAE